MKMLNIKKTAIAILAMFALMFLSVIPAFASDASASVATNVVDQTKQGAAMGETNLNAEDGNVAGLPTASLDDIQSKAESKMFSLVTLLQTIGKPFFVVCFIISTVITIVGLFGRAGVWKGVIGMFVSGILYACVMYAPEIVQWIQIWVTS